MQKIIWCCWFQGRHQAPELVRKCLQSWQTQNPGWDFRCLDADNITRYVDLGSYVDLKRQTITAASLSDLLRLLLLHEYGGVWVDATTYCNLPLDEWLMQAAYTGFFAFAHPAEDRELATWFLAARSGNPLLAKWTARALAYWRGRVNTVDYFWVHHQFGELCAIDRDALQDWQATPRISADGPHAIQFIGPEKDFDEHRSRIDWTTPLFKLVHRLDWTRLNRNSIVRRLLDPISEPDIQDLSAPTASGQSHLPLGQLKVGTENLGDHIQILAAESLLQRAGLKPSFYVDRDHGIAHPLPEPFEAGAGILMNGWFKTNPAEWPPHPAYKPLYLGFHIRLFQSPSLLSAEALAHYSANGPIGCRDRYTLALLQQHGVSAFLSHCLSLGFPKRIFDPDQQKSVFVVSRDRGVVQYLPASISPYLFVSHYSKEDDFVRNKQHAFDLLTTYRNKARLVITTLLHCALPAIAMGIPVVVFYPPNTGEAQQSDRERFSSLSELVRVFHLNEASLVDWSGYTPDVSTIKLKLLDAFFTMVGRWGKPTPPSIEGIAPSTALPVPGPHSLYDYMNDPERLARLADKVSPDRQKWGSRSSYNSDWSGRSKMSAKHIRDGSRVLEIGTGTGALSRLVMDRCRYVGADLQPLDHTTLALDIERDALPPGPWDIIVLLGVLEYLYDPVAALGKIGLAAPTVMFSYCLSSTPDPLLQRRTRGWVNDLSEAALFATMMSSSFSLRERETINAADDFEQHLFVFDR